MNGETNLIKKCSAVNCTSDEDPFFVSGTSICNGEAQVIVLAVGKNSYEGKIK